MSFVECPYHSPAERLVAEAVEGGPSAITGMGLCFRCLFSFSGRSGVECGRVDLNVFGSLGLQPWIGSCRCWGGPCSSALRCGWFSSWPPPSKSAIPIGGGSRGAGRVSRWSPPHWLEAWRVWPRPLSLLSRATFGRGFIAVAVIPGLGTRGRGCSSDRLPRPAGPARRQFQAASLLTGGWCRAWPWKQILKELDECYERFSRETDGAQKRRMLHCVQRALIRSQELGDEKIQIVSQMVELVENRTRQVDSHVELFEAQQELGDTAGNSGKAGADRPKGEAAAQADKPNSKRSRRQRNNENRENASSNHDHDDGASGTPKEKKAKTSKKKKRSKAKAEREASPADLPIDPNEPTYCLCNQVSYGEMIGCDNDECPIEWFHFSCVGLNHKPKGKWYCPKCRGENEKTMDKALEKSKKERAYNR
uniref:Inhibitor of growth protein n=1 Tax=Gorilla gorilla gorilla TaxID=9595 RepID=G3RB52_GORGO